MRDGLGRDVLHLDRPRTASGGSTRLHYPADLDGEVHDHGRIWSRALWDIHETVKNPMADTIILDAQIGFPGTTMTDLANRTITTAQSLYGNSVATKVRAAFHARGIV